MKKEYISNLLTLCLMLCAVVMTGLVVKKEVFTPKQAAIQKTEPTKEIKDWKKYISEEQGIGNHNAPVEITVFSDYQCPFCKLNSQNLDQIQELFPSKVHISYHHFPLENIHPHARNLATASVCAADQGSFSEMHHVIYKTKVAKSDVLNYTQLMQEAKVSDQKTFLSCMEDNKAKEKVSADMALAKELGLDGAPALIINGKLYSGAVPLDQLKEIIQELVN